MTHKTIKPFVILLFMLFSLSAYSQSSTIAQWSRDNLGTKQLCFYPTTLRMVNLNKDKDFNDMVKDIKKLKIILTDKKSRLNKEEIKTLKKGIKAEDYKDMVMVNAGKQSIHVYVKEKDSQPIGFAGIVNTDSSLIVIDLEGKVSPAMIQKLISGDIDMGGISKIYDISKMKESNPKSNPNHK